MNKQRAMIATLEGSHWAVGAPLDHACDRYEIVGGYKRMIDIQRVTQRLRKGDALFVAHLDTQGVNDGVRIDAMAKTVLEHRIQLILVLNGREIEVPLDP